MLASCPVRLLLIWLTWLREFGGVVGDVVILGGHARGQDSNVVLMRGLILLSRVECFVEAFSRMVDQTQ